MSDRFGYLDVTYDDKEWGNIIDPTEWNQNFKEIETAFNTLTAELNSGIITDEDKQVFVATYNEATCAEVENAVQLGKIITLVYSGMTYFMMKKVSTSKYIFYGLDVSLYGFTVGKIVLEDDEWTQSNMDVPSINYLEENYASKTYVDNAIADISEMEMTVIGNKLVCSYK